MLRSPYLSTITVLLLLLYWTHAAKAQENNLALSFELPASGEEQTVPLVSISLVSLSTSDHEVPTPAEIAAADSSLTYVKEVLPPIEATELRVPASSTRTAIDTVDTLALTFLENTISIDDLTADERHLETEDSKNLPTAVYEVETRSTSYDTLGLDDWIFHHGSNSLVARTVGSAEGTRQSDGKRTQAYYGHVDPGNGVWNLGTFSYQHGAESPEAADKQQLTQLKQQGLELESQAIALGIQLSLEEKLNGLDLANQAPLAALDKGGYIDRLAQAKRLQMKGSEAILWARTYAYIDPDTRQWNAPGLGNNVHSISQDQERRISAISRAVKAYDPVGINIADLSHLDPITLEATSQTGLSEESPKVAAAETIAAHTGGSQMAMSFVLPPSEAVGAITNTISPKNVEATDSASTTSTADSGEALSVAAIVIEDKIVTGDIADDVGVSFISTGNITGNITTWSAPANLSVDPAIENTAAKPEVTASSELDLFSLDTAEAPSETHHQVTSTQVREKTDGAHKDSIIRLQELLAGVNPTKLVDIDVLVGERAHPEPQDPPRSSSQGSLWRIEDKIVPEKR